MTTRPNIMMTLVISAAASALILANSAPVQAGGHHGMMGGGSHLSSQPGMISNSPSSTKSSMYDNAPSSTKSSMYDVKINTGTSSSGTNSTRYGVKMNEIPSPWQSGKVKGLKSLTTKMNDATRTKLGLGKGSTVTNSQLTPFTSQAMKSIQKQALFGNQTFPFTHPKGTPTTGKGSETGTGTGATKFNPKDLVFGNQPYTHPRETTGTGTGSDTGTGAGSGPSGAQTSAQQGTRTKDSSSNASTDIFGNRGVQEVIGDGAPTGEAQGPISPTTGVVSGPDPNVMGGGGTPKSVSQSSAAAGKRPSLTRVGNCWSPHNGWWHNCWYDGRGVKWTCDNENSHPDTATFNPGGCPNSPLAYTLQGAIDKNESAGGYPDVPVVWIQQLLASYPKGEVAYFVWDGCVYDTTGIIQWCNPDYLAQMGLTDGTIIWCAADRLNPPSKDNPSTECPIFIPWWIPPNS